MELKVCLPSPALAHCFSLYYYIHYDYPMIEDRDRADVGYLRFLFTGDGNYEFANGNVTPAYDEMILGPSTVHARYLMNGPLHGFGAVLLPEFWGALVGRDASEFANRCTNAALLIGEDITVLRDELSGVEHIDAMAELFEHFMIRRLKAVDPDHRDAIGKIGDWLRNDPIPSPEVLYASASLGARQMMRVANRYFGAPPKMLARKYRALRTASLIVSGSDVTDDMLDHYSDRAHLSREVKQFTGLTPRDLKMQKSPIMQATLAPGLFNYDAPWT
jgi:AraC-like DNA-binding protein